MPELELSMLELQLFVLALQLSLLEQLPEPTRLLDQFLGQQLEELL